MTPREGSLLQASPSHPQVRPIARLLSWRCASKLSAARVASQRFLLVHNLCEWAGRLHCALPWYPDAVCTTFGTHLRSLPSTPWALRALHPSCYLMLLQVTCSSRRPCCHNHAQCSRGSSFPQAQASSRTLQLWGRLWRQLSQHLTPGGCIALKCLRVIRVGYVLCVPSWPWQPGLQSTLLSCTACCCPEKGLSFNRMQMWLRAAHL